MAPPASTSRSYSCTSRRQMAGSDWWRSSTSSPTPSFRAAPLRRGCSIRIFSRSMRFSSGDCTPGSGGTIRAGSLRPGILESTVSTRPPASQCRINRIQPLTGERDAEIPDRAGDTERGSTLASGAESDFPEVLRRTAAAGAEYSVGAELRDGGQDHLRVYRAEREHSSRAREAWGIPGGPCLGGSDDHRSDDG